MAQSTAIVRNTLPFTTVGETVDFSKTSFGTVAAALLGWCNANATNNPQTSAMMGYGLWDGTNQRCTHINCTDNQANAVTQRHSENDRGITTGAASTNDYTLSAITDGVRATFATDNTGVGRFVTALLMAGVSAKVVTLTTNATQNATATTASLGFAPKAAFVITIGHTASDLAAGAGARFSVGFARQSDGLHRMIAFGSTNGAANEQATIQYSETRVAGEAYSDALAWSAEITTWGSDDLTVTTRDGAGGDVIFILALGGADLSFDCGTLTTPTATGNSTVTTTVTPESVLLFLSTATSTTLETGSGANGVMYGAADANGQYSHTMEVEDAAATMNADSVATATKILDLDSSSGGARTNLCDATITLNTSDFTLNYTTVDATARKGFWVAFGAAAPSPATEITLSGPTSGPINQASSNFTVGADGTITGTITVTPTDSSGQGSFSPSTVQISSGTPTATFTYTPTTSGNRTIGTSDDGGLANNDTVTYDSQAAATAVTITGPSTGYVNVASSNFTIGLDGTIAGSLIVTPTDSSGRGTFSPTSVTLTSGTTQTVTYTADTAGARTIGTSDNGSLANTQTVTFTASALDIATTILATQAASLKGYWKCDETGGTTLADSSGNSKTLTLSGGYTLSADGVSFNGTSGYASRTDSVLGATLPAQLTIHCMVKANGAAGTNARLVSFGNSADANPYCSLATGNTDPTIHGLVRTDAGVTSLNEFGSGIAVEENYWHSLFLRRNGSNVWTCWIDGVEQPNSATVAPGTTTLDRTSIGALVRNTVSAYANVTMKHVAVWTTAITDAEIAAIQVQTGITPWTQGPYSFSLLSRSNALTIETIQGAGHDFSTNYFVTDTGVSHSIFRFTRSGSTYTQVENYNATGDMPAGATQINGIDYYDGFLWIGVNNFSTAPAAGWIMKFSVNPIAYVATYSVGANYCEGGAWQNVGNGAEFWAIYHDLGAVRRYDSSFNLIDQYTLPLMEHDTNVASERGLSQGAQWYTRGTRKFFICQTHAVNIDTGTYIHEWNGSGFDPIQYITALGPAVGQSLHWETATPASGSIMVFAERDGASMYLVRGTFTDASATTITLTGPSSGAINTASSGFTVATNGTLDHGQSITITMTDSSGAGTFTPSSITLTIANPAESFTYTPTTTGVRTIGLTNDGGLTNPAGVTYTVGDGSSGGGGTSGRLRGKKPTIIRFSDFAARDEYEKALRQAIEQSEIIVREPFSAKVEIKPLPNVLVGTNINIEQAIQEREQREDEEKIMLMFLAMGS